MKKHRKKAISFLEETGSLGNEIDRRTLIDANGRFRGLEVAIISMMFQLEEDEKK